MKIKVEIRVLAARNSHRASGAQKCACATNVLYVEHFLKKDIDIDMCSVE